MSAAPSAPSAAASQPPPMNMNVGLQFFLILDMMVRLQLWGMALAITCTVFSRFGLWKSLPLQGASFGDAWQWAMTISNWIILFNMVYVVELIVLRLLIPTPRTGVYPTNRPLKMTDPRARQLVYACFLGVLTKARYEAPFPAFLVYHFSAIPPLRWLYVPLFGPKTQSTNVTDPLCLDPSYVEIGKNVVIGSNATLAGHIQVPDMVAIRKTVIEDDVLVGANSIVFGGAHIKKGAIVAAGSIVAPYTIIGPNEYWSGVPAVKIRNWRESPA